MIVCIHLTFLHYLQNCFLLHLFKSVMTTATEEVLLSFEYLIFSVLKAISQIIVTQKLPLTHISCSVKCNFYNINLIIIFRTLVMH